MWVCICTKMDNQNQARESSGVMVNKIKKKFNYETKKKNARGPTSPTI